MAEVHLKYLMRNKPLLFGGLLLLGLFLFSAVGQLVLDLSMADPLSVMATQPPSWDLPFGSDTQGRDLLTVLVLGTMLTGKTGLLAGAMGVVIGAGARSVCGLLPRLRRYRFALDDRCRSDHTAAAVACGNRLSAERAHGFNRHGDSDRCALRVHPARQIRAQALVLREFW